MCTPSSAFFHPLTITGSCYLTSSTPVVENNPLLLLLLCWSLCGSFAKHFYLRQRSIFLPPPPLPPLPSLPLLRSTSIQWKRIWNLLELFHSEALLIFCGRMIRTRWRHARDCIYHANITPTAERYQRNKKGRKGEVRRHQWMNPVWFRTLTASTQRRFIHLLNRHRLLRDAEWISIGYHVQTNS